MKTKIEILILLVLFLLSSYLIYTFVGPNEESLNIIEVATNDEKKFESEFESLNGISDIDNKTYPNVSITSKNYVKYLEVDEVIDMLNNGTGVIFFASAKNLISRNVVSVLVDAAILSKTNIYYYDPADIMDQKVKNKEIEIIKEGTDEYYEIVDILSSYLLRYKGLDDNSIKRLYMPTVVFVKDGNIIGTHSLSIDAHINSYDDLTYAEKVSLKSIYLSGMEEIK